MRIEKATVRQISEFIEKAMKNKSLSFRQFIYVNLGIAGEVCENLLFAYKNA